MDDSHVVWPSKEYETEFWRRAKEAITKGEPFVQLPALPGELPQLPLVPEEVDRFLGAFRIVAVAASAPQEIHHRYMLLCAIVLRTTLVHQQPCACKLCQVVEAWLNGESSSEMLERILKAP